MSLWGGLYLKGFRSMNVPFNDLSRIHKEMQGDLLGIYSNVLETSAFIGGEAINRFEEKLSDFWQLKHSITLSSGTAALIAGFVALREIRNVKKVWIPGNTFQASAEAAILAGLDISIYDVDEDLRNPTKTQVSNLVREARRESGAVVMLVHMNGVPVETDLNDEEWQFVVEDSSQAIGASPSVSSQLGSKSIWTAVSFYPGKNLGALGDGGALLTNDSSVSSFVRAFADHGKVDGMHRQIGGTFRLDALQASILSLKLDRVKRWNEERRLITESYNKNLSDAFGKILIPCGVSPNGHIFSILLNAKVNRDKFRSKLGELGVSTGIHYAESLSMTGVFGSNHFTPTCDDMARRLVSLPIFPGMTEGEIEYVIQSCNGVISQVER